MQNPEPLLSLDHTKIQLGPQQFGPFSLTVQTGERIAILGPSGAGKSTLLKLMSRELLSRSGSIRLHDRPLADWTLIELSQRRAVLPQSSEIAFGLEVELVVALGRVARQADSNQAAIVSAALQLAHASHLAGRRFDTLSGGEQARVQLARIFAQLWDVQEGLVLVDEPLAALDPGLQFDLLDSLQTFICQRGHALVAILHDINHALLAFDRLWLIKQGRLQANITADASAIPQLELLYGIRLRQLKSDCGEAMMVAPVPRHPSAPAP
ncbi:ATP-binding cassette domain-containing protein [Parachitinimonas caeni]|uniref:ATP-binding cassette domain-containing protein n=1 Tax=Parachitinimonas caeni TaxID=3031301 RepID=A0ABT7DWF1_9NEIS|nr:ATP-binding cassette domain-containing protein [Parachitinimonas caeni]MDK2122982.1 ATP-binding cassette domain-containing protein [Parachitinimonas caeni]